MNQNLNDMQVYNCMFQVNLISAEMSIKFPCTYSVEIKSMNNKITIANTKNKASAVNSIVSFNQFIRFETELLYNSHKRQFVKKQVLFLVNLTSIRRPDQQKLVGRVSVDLSQISQTNKFSMQKPYKLQYCSVNATLTFSANFIGKKLSVTSPQNFDKDSFSDFQSFVAGIHGRQGSHPKKNVQDSEKTVEMPWKSRNNETFDRNKIIQESNNEDNQSKTNTIRGNTLTNTNVGYTDPKFVNARKNSNSYENQRSKSPPPHYSAPIQNQEQTKNNTILHQQLNKQKQLLSRIRSQISSSDRPYLKNDSSSAFNQPATQYEQILRNSHAHEKKIFEQQKKMLNDLLKRQKQEHTHTKQKVQNLEKKLYQDQLKLCNIDGRIQTYKRQMTILQRQKDLQIKQLRSKIERITHEKQQKMQLLQKKEEEMRQIRNQLHNKQLQNKKQIEQQQKMQQKVENALKRVMSSDQIVNKLKKQKKETVDVLQQAQNKIDELINQNNDLKNNLTLINELETQIKTLKNQKQKIVQSHRHEIEQKLSEFDNQRNQLNFRIQTIQLQKDELEGNLHLKSQQIHNELDARINTMLQQIEQFKLKQSEDSDRIIVLQLKIKEKEQQIQENTSNFEKQIKTIQRNSIKQMQSKNTLIQQLKQKHSKQIKNIDKKTQDLNAQIKKLQTQIMNKNNKISYLQKQSALNIENQKAIALQNKQYITELQKQILQYSQQLQKNKQNCMNLQNKSLQLKTIIDQMKIYEKGLEQDILRLQTTSQQNTNLIQNSQYKKSMQFKQFQSKVLDQINSLKNEIDEYNRLLIQRNNEIQTLNNSKNQTKQYILGLQTQVLRLTKLEQQNKSNMKKISQIQKHSKQLMNQIKQKNIQINELRMNQLSLEQSIARITQQLQNVKTNNKNEIKTHKFEQVDNKTDAKFKLQMQMQMQMQNKMKELKKKLEQKTIYANQLQQKVLNQNKGAIQQNQYNSNNTNKNEQLIKLKEYLKQLQSTILDNNHSLQIQTYKQNEKNLNKKMEQYQTTILRLKQYQKQLEQNLLSLFQKQSMYGNKTRQYEQTIRNLREYQQGLEQRILQDHDHLKEGYSLKQSMKLLQDTIKHQKQYQEGLEQRILQDHENKGEQHNLKQSIKLLQNQIKYHKQYQEGLQQKILQDHGASIQEQHQLKKSINILESKIKHHKQYQNGLQQKILQDHDRLQKQNQLKNSINFLQQKIKHQLQYQEGLQQKILQDHQYLQKIQGNGKEQQKQQQQSIHYKCQLQNKQLRQLIDELEQKIFKSSVKVQDQDFLALQDQINEKNMYIQQLQAKITKLMEQITSLQQKIINIEANKHETYIPEQPTQIRVLQVNSESEGEEKQNPVKDINRQSRNRNSKEQKKQSTNDKKEQANNQLHKNQQNDQQMKLKQMQQQRQQMIKKLQEFKIKTQQNQQKNVKLQTKLKKLQSKATQKNTGQNSEHIKILEQQNYQLQITVQQYETRIKLLKAKQLRIQQALVIIEQQSQKIAVQLDKKYCQCQQLTAQLMRRDNHIVNININKQEQQQNGNNNLINNNNQNDNKNEKQESQLKQINKLKQKIQYLQMECQKQQTLANTKQKTNNQIINNHNKQIQAMQSQIQALNNELQQKNNKKQKQNLQQLQTKIKSLQTELNQANNQLMTSKRLVVKLRQTRQNKSMVSQPQHDIISTQEYKKLQKRVQQLQEQLFSIQSNQNQKDIQIQGLKNEINGLIQHNSKNINKEDSSQIHIQQIRKLQTLVDSMKLNEQKISKNNVTLQQNNKILINQQKNMQNLLKSERLDYYSKRRQASQKIEGLQAKINEIHSELNGKLQIIEQLRKQIIDKTEQNNSIQSFYKNEFSIRQAQIQKLQAQIQQKDKIIRQYQSKIQKMLTTQPISSQQSLQLKQIQSELNFYSQQLTLVSKKLQQIQPQYNVQKEKLLQQEQIIQQLSEQLKICQQQNQFNQIKVQSSSLIKQLSKQNQTLKKNIQKMQQQAMLVTQKLQNFKKANNQRVYELQNKLMKAEAEAQRVAIQLQQKQMEHLNTQLDLQFKIREKNEKSQLAIANSFTQNQARKSLSASQDVGNYDIQSAAKSLKQILNNRSNKPTTQKQMQTIIIRVNQLQQQLFDVSSSTKQKGLILEKTRLVSMQFSKLKVNIMKSKLSNEQRIKMLQFLKPIELSIKQILKLSEIYSQNLLASELSHENSATHV